MMMMMGARYATNEDIFSTQYAVRRGKQKVGVTGVGDGPGCTNTDTCKKHRFSKLTLGFFRERVWRRHEG